MRIAFVFLKGRLARLEETRQGKLPSEFFYGAIQLEKAGHEIGYYEVDDLWAPGILGGILNIISQRGWLPHKVDGTLIVQSWYLLHELKKYDLICGTTSGIGNSICFWKLLGFFDKPIVTIHCGLFNNPYPWIRRMLTIPLMNRMYTVLFGDGEMQDICRFDRSLENKVSVNQFGVDVDFWTPGNNVEGEYILSVGNDGRRDYETLIKAAEGLPFKVIILTSLEISSSLPNVKIVKSSWHKSTISDSELRDLYRGAKVVIVPLKESKQPSGQSVTLQAMSCGKTVVLTKTDGLWSTEMLNDGRNVLFVEPGNTEQLRRIISKVYNEDLKRQTLGMSARRTVCTKATISHFASGMKTAFHHASGHYS